MRCSIIRYPAACVWVCTHPLHMHAYIHAVLRGMCNDELVCLDLPLMIY